MTTPLIVRSGRNPHAICLAIGLVLISGYGLFFSPASVSLDSGLTLGQRIAFGTVSSLGAAATLAGLYWRRADTGLLVERAGQVMLGTGALVYVYVLCLVSTFERSGIITTIGCSIAVGSGWRVVQITRDLRRWREALRKAGA